MAALRTYIDDEEMYDDNAQLLVNPATMEVSLDDGDVDQGDDIDEYAVMDLLRMDSDGGWMPDDESVAQLVAEYLH